LARQNQLRVEQANERDAELLGKYLSSKMPFVNVTVCGPDDVFKPPPWLLEIVWTVAGMGVDTPS
jgi:hypothetical protein